MALIRNVGGGGQREVPDAVARVVVGQGRAVYADDTPEPEREPDVEPEPAIPGVSTVSELIDAVDRGDLDWNEVVTAELERNEPRKTLLAHFDVDLDDEPEPEPDLEPETVWED